jgi:hypothetical protein
LRLRFTTSTSSRKIGVEAQVHDLDVFERGRVVEPGDDVAEASGAQAAENLDRDDLRGRRYAGDTDSIRRDEACDERAVRIEIEQTRRVGNLEDPVTKRVAHNVFALL